jgi:RecB family exonuclease
MAGPVNGSAALSYPAPAPGPFTILEDDRGMLLSPSQVDVFDQCPAKWRFKYLDKLPERKSSSLSVGIVVHQALEANFRQKIASRQDLPPGEVMDACAVMWSNIAQETMFSNDEDPAELGQLAEACVERYMVEAAPKIQPAAVEMGLEGEIGGVRVRGRLDILLDVEGTLIDMKTAATKPRWITASQKVQLTTYDLLCPQSRGKVRIDTMVKGRSKDRVEKVQVVPLEAQLGVADVQYTENMYSMTQDAIRDGIYYPRRGHQRNPLCSRRMCCFWKACEAEYGGEVEP